MNANTTYELKARAFELMTGHLAPGKDSPQDWGTTLEERGKAWDEWWASNGPCVNAMLKAMGEIISSDD